LIAANRAFVDCSKPRFGAGWPTVEEKYKLQQKAPIGSLQFELIFYYDSTTCASAKKAFAYRINV
jgi:hypothetical protein